jgi:hypothetical protein
MKKKLEYVEGRQALKNFDTAMDKLMKVPRSQIKAQMETERQAKAPKRIAKQSASKNET